MSFCLAITSSTMLKSNGERGHPCLVPDLSGKAFEFLTIRYYVSCRFFVDILHQVVEVALYSWFGKSLSMNAFWILSNAFPVSVDMIYSFSLACWCDGLH